jgi:hypothetical protein
MTSDRTPDPEHRPFATTLVIAILLIVIPAIGLLSVYDYLQAEERMTSDLATLQSVTEKSIRESITDVDTGLKLFDDSLNLRLERGLALFVEEYGRTEGNPAEMDLFALREQLGGDMDLYVINASGVVEYTTNSRDRGLDFRENPDFYAEITRMRLGNEFSPAQPGRSGSTPICRRRITGISLRSGSCRARSWRNGTGCAHRRARRGSSP